VAQLSGLLKRSILDSLWHAAPGGISIEDAIRGFKAARWDDIKGGSLILSTSGGGYSVSFASADTYRRISPDLFLELGQEFLEVLGDCQSSLGATASDDALFAEMLKDSRLWGTSCVFPDFSIKRI